MSHQLRRTKNKLKVLDDTENIMWLLSDIINEVWENPDFETHGQIIDGVRKKYLLYIQENKKKNLEQKEIEFDDR